MFMLFFELLQVGLGNREKLSVVPSAEKWTEVYAESERQAVTGLLIHGINRLPAEQRPSKILLLQWIEVGQMIEQRNHLLDERCKELMLNLSAVGLHPSILKGQGVAQYHPESLQRLRQPGDIDVYVSDGREKTITYAKSLGQKDIEWDYQHLHLKVWNDTEVEMNYHVEVLLNLWKNRKLQSWFSKHQDAIFNVNDNLDLNSNTNRTNEKNGFMIPTVDFNVFYILLHIYRHFLYEGVGLRQIVDYYFVLKNLDLIDNFNESYAYKMVGEFGMEKFAKGLMWVMHEVLGMPYEWMLWEPDEEEGRYILKQVMAGGNFGYHDERLKHTGSKFGAVKAILIHNFGSSYALSFGCYLGSYLDCLA